MLRWILILNLAFASGTVVNSCWAFAQEAAAAAPVEEQTQAVDEVNTELVQEVAVELVDGYEQVTIELDTPELVNEVVANDPQLLLLRNYTRVNSALLRRVCTLTENDEAELAKMNDAWIATQMQSALNANNAVAGVARFLKGIVVQNRNQNQPQEVLQRVKTEIDRHLDSLLTPEQLASFHQEREARHKFRMAALAEVLVSIIDQRVYLTDEQRKDLLPAIEKGINSDLYWQFYFQNQTYVPKIESNVLSILTPAQRESLKNANAWNYELAQVEMQLLGNAPIVIAK